MAKLRFFCDRQAAVFIGGKEVGHEPYFADQNECVSVSVLPILTDVACLAYTVVIRLERDRVFSVTGGAQVIVWDGGNYDVYLRPPKLPFRHSPVTLAQTGDRHLATLYDDGEMHLMCEGECFFVHDVPRLASYNLTSSERDGFLVMLTGKTQENAYVLVVSTANGGRVVHEHLGAQIEANENGVTVRKNLLDMRRRVATTCYNSEGKIVSQSFERTARKLPDALVPYAFLEALSCGDTEDAFSMLEDDLKHESALREFFGNFDVLTHPVGEENPGGVATFCRCDGITVPRIFSFDVKGGIITAVSEK